MNFQNKTKDQRVRGAVEGGMMGATMGGPWGALAGAGIGAVTGGWDGILGGGDSEADREKALREIMAEYDGIAPPELEAQEFQRQIYEGNVTPEMMAQLDPIKAQQMQAALAGDTAMGDIQVDPRFKEDQMATLGALQNLVDSGGMTLTDQANLSKLQGDVALADRGRQGAIMQDMQARGMGGSGLELLQRQMASQAAQQQESQAALDIAGGAQDRALQALMSKGSLAGNIRGQEFGEQAQVAQARDAIEQFNARNRQGANQFNAGVQNNTNQFNQGMAFDTNRYNTDTANAAAFGNRDARQQVSNNNTQIANQQKEYNQGVQQQNFNNQARMADKRAGVKEKVYGYVDERGERKDRQNADMANTLIKAGTTYFANKG